MARHRAVFTVAFVFVIVSLSYSQDYDPIVFTRPNQQIILHDVHLRPAADSTPQIVPAMEAVIADPLVCCGKDSALGDQPVTGDFHSLQELGSKLNGSRRTLSDGHPVTLSADYVPAASINSDSFVVPLMKHQPILMQWNSHIYVVYGVNYGEVLYESGRHDYVIQKILLLDPSSSGAAHETAFDRQKDDWSKVQGLLLVKASRT